MVFQSFHKCCPVLRLNLLRQNGKADGSSYADGRRPSHLQFINRIPDILRPSQGEKLNIIRQLRLVNNDKRLLFTVIIHYLII